MSKLTHFDATGYKLAVIYIETQTVKEGIECDIYSFVGDNSKDLAIVKVLSGYKTPLQKVLLGDKTIEGLYSGSGTLTVRASSGDVNTHVFNDLRRKEVVVEVGQIMQWHADTNTDLVFYEICEPPYVDGRFENLPDIE